MARSEPMRYHEVANKVAITLRRSAELSEFKARQKLVGGDLLSTRLD